MRVYKKPPTQISKVNIKRLESFVNKNLIANITPEEVYNKHIDLYNHITMYKLVTRKTYLQTIIDSLKRCTIPNESLIEKYSNEVYQWSLKCTEEYKTNDINHKRSSITYNQLCSVMSELTTHFNNMTENQSIHNLLIILNMNLRQPPLRAEISNMYVLTATVTSSNSGLGSNSLNYIFPLDPTYNYLIRNPYQYVLHNYKTKYKYNVRTIPINNEYLVSFLEESFKRYPRTWLLQQYENSKIKPLGYNKYLYLLKSVFGNGIGADQLRSIYISEFMKSNPNVRAREQLAYQMLHSVYSQALFYNKTSTYALPYPPQDK